MEQEGLTHLGGVSHILPPTLFFFFLTHMLSLLLRRGRSLLTQINLLIGDKSWCPNKPSLLFVLIIWNLLVRYYHTMMSSTSLDILFRIFFRNPTIEPDTRKESIRSYLIHNGLKPLGKTITYFFLLA